MPQSLPLSDVERHLPHHDMILVEGGSFLMGSADKEARSSEKPVHEVQVPAFYLAKYLVTQALWEAVVKKNPSRFKGADRPVENISWNDCQNFLKKLNKLTGQAYRLSTEAEWEFAARGGSHSEGYLYAGSDKLKDVGWYEDNSGRETHPVGQKAPNELGIYDLSGNVWEWCEDDWHRDYDGAPQDGSGWKDEGSRGTHRVYRGGGWSNGAQDCRVSYRNFRSPEGRGNSFGFRLALSFQVGGSLSGFPVS